MLKIRLQRFGKKNQPTFRVVLVDSRRSSKSGNFKEILGSFHPSVGEAKMDKERLLHWIGEGAQLSDRVHNMLVKEGIISAPKRDVSSKKNTAPQEGEGVETETHGGESAGESPQAEENIGVEIVAETSPENAEAPVLTAVEKPKDETPPEEEKQKEPEEEKKEESQETENPVKKDETDEVVAKVAEDSEKKEV